MNYKDRIMACYEMVCAFKNSEMIKSLIGCTPVKNPIRTLLEHVVFCVFKMLYRKDALENNLAASCVSVLNISGLQSV